LNVDQDVLNREALFPKLVQTGFQRRHPVLGIHPKGDADPAGIRRGYVDFEPGHATSRATSAAAANWGADEACASVGIQPRILFGFARGNHGRM
jgi:hypothetical protein